MDNIKNLTARGTTAVNGIEIVTSLMVTEAADSVQKVLTWVCELGTFICLEQ